jgi:hypothetical protein
VYVNFNGTIRSVTAALSVTKNAGTNWCNAGGAELATKEIDYFVYMGYNATDGVVIGFSRIPYGTSYASFSTTSTAETYCGISTITTAAATDPYVVVGRFAATLSAGAGYTWTVPTYTPDNLIQRPVYETRWLDWVPAQSAAASLTWTSPTVTVARYKLHKSVCFYSTRVSATLGGSAANELYLTVPFEIRQSASPVACGNGFAGTVAAIVWSKAGTPDQLAINRYDASNYATSGALAATISGMYEI